MVRDSSAGGLTDLDLRDLTALGRIADLLFIGREGRTPGAARRRLRAGHGEEFLDHQSYSPGTDARLLDWRASARLPDPVIRRRGDEGASEWMVCLDNSASMAAPGPRRWRLALHLATAFLHVLLRHGHTAGLLAYSDNVDALCPPGRGEPQFRRGLAFLDRLAPPRAGAASTLSACAPHLRPRRSAILIGDFLMDGDLAVELDRLRASSGELQLVRISDAEDVPDLGRGPATIEDAEIGSRLSLSDGETARAVARRRLDELDAALVTACAQRRIPLTHCDSSMTWLACAVSHLRAASPPRA